jgi:hypothetical protein
LLDLNIQDIVGLQRKEGAAMSTDVNGEPVRATEFITATYHGNIAIPSGQAIVVKQVQRISGSSDEHTIIVVMARLVD